MLKKPVGEGVGVEIEEGTHSSKWILIPDIVILFV